MKLFLRGICAAMLLSALPSTTLAQTNSYLEYWVRSLDFTLTAVTNSPLVTNGIVATAKTRALRITSRDLIRSLSSLPAYTLDKALTNYSVIVTNFQPGPDVFVTNIVEAAYPVYLGVTPPPYSVRARLLYFEPVGTNSFADPLIVIRDGFPATDYIVSQYFETTPVSFDLRPEPIVRSGRFDIEHDLISATDASIRQFRFDANGFSGLPIGTFFEVQGYTEEKQFSLIKRGVILDHQASESFTAQVAGTGQLIDPSGFCVLRGTIRSAGGRYEAR